MARNDEHDWLKLRRLQRLEWFMAVTGLPMFMVIGATGWHELWIPWVAGGTWAYLLGRRLQCPRGGAMAKSNIFSIFRKDLQCDSCGARPEGGESREGG